MLKAKENIFNLFICIYLDTQRDLLEFWNEEFNMQ